MPLLNPASADNPAASVIIPVFNGLRITRACLEALFADANRTVFEIIVIDNGSTDGVQEYLDAQTGRINLIRPGENLGFARANNIGARAAQGEYLVLLNNDTLPRPGWLDALVNAARSADDVGIVGAKLLFPFNGRVQHAGVVISSDMKLSHLYEGESADHPGVNKRREFQIVTAACMLVKRNCFERLLGFDERFVNGFEDVDLCLRARRLGWRVLYEPAAVVMHYGGATEGRGLHEEANSRLLTKLWGGKITPDEDKYLNEDKENKSNLINGDAHQVPRGEHMKELKDRARDALKNGDVAEALELFQALEKIDPDDRMTLRYLSVIHEKRHDYPKAGEFLKRLDRLGSDAQTVAALAHNAMKRRAWQEALDTAQTALEMAGADAEADVDARELVADAWFKLGELGRAEIQYDQILLGEPANLRALTGKGTVALSRQNVKQALEYFDRALLVHPHHPRALLGRGLALLGLGRRVDAAQAISESLTIEPENSWALASLLPLLSETGQLDLADKHLKAYLALFPDDHPMLLARAGVAFATGRFDLSRRLLDLCLAQDPSYPGAVELDRELSRVMAPQRPRVAEAAFA